MIKKINIKSVATFDDTGVIFDDLREVNFIYGGNGCGKTTLSNYLANQNQDKYSNCNIEWAAGEQEEIIVYNKAFRDANLVEDIKGIFTLGENSKKEAEKINDKKKELEEEKRKLADKQTSIGALQNSIESATKGLKEYLWKNVYKKNEDFGEFFRGFMKSEAFYKKIMSVFETKAYVTAEQKLDLKIRYDKLFASGDPIRVPRIEPICEVESLNEILQDEIWRTKIIGKSDVPIADMIQRLGINDWVYKGKNAIADDSDVCPFCQQHTITQSFRNQLESYFDESFLQSTSKLTSLKESYINICDAINKKFINLIDSAGNSLVSYIDKVLLENAIASVSSLLSSNLEKINAKIAEPSRSVELTDVSSVYSAFKVIIDSANAKIDENNGLVDNLKNQREVLIAEIWKYLTNIAEPELSKVAKTCKSCETQLTKYQLEESELKKSCLRLQDELSLLESNVTSITPTITAINKKLKGFGFNNFMLEESKTQKNHYRIVRQDGSFVEDTLSEGERTFITFLYFMHRINGSYSSDGINNNRILVIDDPISSLDSNVLFVVSTLLKDVLNKLREGTKPSNIKQVIILTHNVYFYKEVSFIGSGRTQCKVYRHWILYKNNGCSMLKAYHQECPIKGSYELLWKELKDRREEIDCISIQNIMRRIIENYFMVFGGYKNSEILISNIKDQDEAYIAKSLAYWTDEGSHDISDDLFVEHPHIAKEKYYSVFENMFKELGHYAHYKMMMGIEDNEEDITEIKIVS